MNGRGHDEELPPHVVEAIQRGQYLEAVRRYRDSRAPDREREAEWKAAGGRRSSSTFAHRAAPQTESGALRFVLALTALLLLAGAYYLGTGTVPAP